MGDDPIIPGIENNSSANGNYTINNYSISTSQLVALVAVSGLALGIAVGAIVITALAKSDMRAMMELSERRTMDRAALAEREARIARDEVDRLKVAQKINTDH